MKVYIWSKRWYVERAQELSARWYREAREAFERGDHAEAVALQERARFRSKEARALCANLR